MLLIERETVDGTRIAIGRRQYLQNGKKKVSKKYSAEYRDIHGKQRSVGLGVTNNPIVSELLSHLGKKTGRSSPKLRREGYWDG